MYSSQGVGVMSIDGSVISLAARTGPERWMREPCSSCASDEHRGAHSELAAALSYSAHGEPVRRDPGLPRSSRKARPTTVVLSFQGDTHLMTGRMDRTIADHTMNAHRTARDAKEFHAAKRTYTCADGVMDQHPFVDEFERGAPHQYCQF